MKRMYLRFWFWLLVVYSITLIIIEINTSQDFVRNFYTDIEGEVHFYAINTTVSVFLLFATGLMFKASLAILPSIDFNTRKKKFYLSQTIFFCYLACDDRFLIHEKLGHILGVNDAYLILSLGIVEIALILIWGNLSTWEPSTRNNLLKAAICFAIMVVVDGAFPSEMILRLSLEDLAKTWASVFLFLFSWDIFNHNIFELRTPSMPLKR